MSHFSWQAKTISWNGVHFSIPDNWQAIVKDNSHLIFEEDLAPALEVRWVRGRKHISSTKQTEKLWARIKKESKDSLTTIAPPVFFDTLKHHFTIIAFAATDPKKPAGAILSCQRCNMLFLVHFFTQSHSFTEKMSLFFQSLDCHSYLSGNRQWHIQDFSFLLPENFTLDTFAFSFGLSKIAFKNKNCTLNLCRLAPASEHLQRTSFSGLFATFTASLPENHQTIDKTTMMYAHYPTFTERIMARLKRKTPYKWAYFRHIPVSDRIIGAFLESSLPLEQSCKEIIQDSYTIV